MADQFWVHTRFWNRDEDKANWDDRTTLLALYLLTNKHRATEGLYELPRSYITADLDWQPAALNPRLSILVESGFCAYDERARVILVVNALRYQQPATERQVLGALRRLKMLPRTPLFFGLLGIADSIAAAKPLADAMRMEFEWLSDVPPMPTEWDSNTLSLPSTLRSLIFCGGGALSEGGEHQPPPLRAVDLGTGRAA